MSAITGVIGQSPKMTAAKLLPYLTHRGNKKAEVWNNERGSLAAIGLEKIEAHPGPIVTKSDRRAAVFSGRIFNAPSLREELTLHKLSNGSDAELILHLYEEYGLAAFDKLEGHFAVGIIDGDRAILARDPLGVFPLYYGFSNGSLHFASEIKALAGLCPVVNALPQGSTLLSDQGIYPLRSYKPDPAMLTGAQEWTQRLAALLKEAIRDSAPENAPIGVWLSGGVDSSVIAALAQQLHGNIRTFAAGLEGAPDLVYAAKVAKHLGTRHKARVYDLEDALAVLDKVIFHLESFDAPLVRSAIGNYLVAQLAAEYVPFVYSGEGGDELFAGYAYQKEHESSVELTLSVQGAIAALHNTALQRVDRSAAAHQTRAGLPFLDPRVVRFALAIPANLKIRGPNKIDKWPLRQAMVDALPEDVIWRKKAKFWEGAGAADVLSHYAEEKITDSDFATERDLGIQGNLRSKEELLYYRIFQSHFGDRIPLEEVGRTMNE